MMASDTMFFASLPFCWLRIAAVVLLSMISARLVWPLSLIPLSRIVGNSYTEQSGKVNLYLIRESRPGFDFKNPLISFGQPAKIITGSPFSIAAISSLMAMRPQSTFDDLGVRRQASSTTRGTGQQDRPFEPPPLFVFFYLPHTAQQVCNSVKKIEKTNDMVTTDQERGERFQL